MDSLRFNDGRFYLAIIEIEPIRVSFVKVEAVGMGESSPVVPNINDENRAKNRRVELNITMPEGKKQ